MSRSKVTSKFQVTIPRDVREKVKIKPGETISIEAVSKDEIVIRRYPAVANPLEVLIGTQPARHPVPIEELEDMMESR